MKKDVFSTFPKMALLQHKEIVSHPFRKFPPVETPRGTKWQTPPPLPSFFYISEEKIHLSSAPTLRKCLQHKKVSLTYQTSRYVADVEGSPLLNFTLI